MSLASPERASFCAPENCPGAVFSPFTGCPAPGRGDGHQALRSRAEPEWGALSISTSYTTLQKKYNNNCCLIIAFLEKSNAFLTLPNSFSDERSNPYFTKPQNTDTNSRREVSRVIDSTPRRSPHSWLTESVSLFNILQKLYSNSQT